MCSPLTSFLKTDKRWTFWAVFVWIELDESYTGLVLLSAELPQHMLGMGGACADLREARQSVRRHIELSSYLQKSPQKSVNTDAVSHCGSATKSSDLRPEKNDSLFLQIFIFRSAGTKPPKGLI